MRARTFRHETYLYHKNGVGGGWPPVALRRVKLQDLSLLGSAKWRMGRLGSFLCSPNAHTRKGSKGWSGNHCFSKGETAWPVRTWLRNLFRPGLRPDGTSNNARHRLRDRADRAMHPRKAQAVTRPSPMEGAAQSSLEGALRAKRTHRQIFLGIRRPSVACSAF